MVPQQQLNHGPCAGLTDVQSLFGWFDDEHALRHGRGLKAVFREGLGIFSTSPRT